MDVFSLSPWFNAGVVVECGNDDDDGDDVVDDDVQVLDRQSKSCCCGYNAREKLQQGGKKDSTQPGWQ